MATTQTVKKSGVVLKPLKGLTVGTRRTADQVQKARDQRKLDLQTREQQRIAKLQAQIDRAQERQRRREEKAQQEAQAAAERERAAAEAANNPTPVAEPKVVAVKSPAGVGAAKVPGMDKVLKDINADFEKFYGHLFEKYGIKFSGTTPELVKRGYVSLKMRGELPPQMNAVEPTAHSEAGGVYREAARFMQFGKAVGLSAQWLNKEVKIKDDTNTYVLTGLRGKAHNVVLRKKDTNEAYTMPVADFLKVVVK